jgi:hypothetical protein
VVNFVERYCGYSVDRLFSLLNALGVDIDIVVRPRSIAARSGPVWSVFWKWPERNDFISLELSSGEPIGALCLAPSFIG